MKEKTLDIIFSALEFEKCRIKRNPEFVEENLNISNKKEKEGRA